VDNFSSRVESHEKVLRSRIGSRWYRVQWQVIADIHLQVDLFLPRFASSLYFERIEMQLKNDKRGRPMGEPVGVDVKRLLSFSRSCVYTR
jgi:hypothetical protein